MNTRPLVHHGQMFHLSRTQKHARSYFSKGVQFSLQDCDSLIGACHKLSTATFLTTDTSNTPGFARLHDASDSAASTIVWTYRRALFCFGPHSKLVTFYISWYMGQSNIPKSGCCLWNPKRPTQSYASILMIENERCSILSFTLEVIIWYAPDY